MQARTPALVALALALFLAACGPSSAVVQPSPSATPPASTYPSPSAILEAEGTHLPTLTPRPPSLTYPSITPRPTQAPPPTETPQPALNIPTFSGTLYVQRNREIVAFNLATLSERPLGLDADAFQVSPDGRWVALVTDDTLQVADTSGQGLQPIDEWVDGEFIWAPDSRAIAFVKGVARGWQPGCPTTAEIWVVELPGREVRRIDAGCDPAWSPDSTRIAYVSSYDGLAEGPPNVLYLANRYGEHRWSPYQGRETSWLPPGLGYMPRPYLYAPFWSPDGQSILVGAATNPWAGDIVLITLDQVDAHQGGGETIGITGDWHAPIPSPDGRWAMDPWIPEAGGGDIVLYSLSGQECVGSECCWFDEQWCAEFGSKLRVRREESFEFTDQVAWSPDGRFLAVVYCPDEMGSCSGPGLTEVRILDPFTGALSDPLPIQADRDGEIAWRDGAMER